MKLNAGMIWDRHSWNMESGYGMSREIPHEHNRDINTVSALVDGLARIKICCWHFDRTLLSVPISIPTMDYRSAYFGDVHSLCLPREYLPKSLCSGIFSIVTGEKRNVAYREVSRSQHHPWKVRSCQHKNPGPTTDVFSR